MNLVQLKKQIKAKQLDKFYLFTGEEIGLMNMYINQMSPDIVRADSVKDIWIHLTSNTLSSSSKVYVVRDDKEFMGMEKLWTNIEDRIKNGTLVLCLTNADKRSKIYKHFTNNMVEFEKMTDSQLLAYVKKHLPMVSDSNREYLIQLCCNDYNRIDNEIDKLLRIRQVLDCEITKELIEDIIIPPITVTPFNLTDSLICGDYVNSVKYCNTLLANGESGIMLLGLLYTTFKNAALVIGFKGEKDIASKTGVNGWVASNILKNLCYTPSEVLSIMRIIQSYEQGIKTGLCEEKFAIQACILEILTV